MVEVSNNDIDFLYLKNQLTVPLDTFSMAQAVKHAK